MKITTLIAAAALATASTAAVAGNPTDAGTAGVDINIIPEVAGGSSLGSLGGAAPALIALLVIGAVAAGSGS